jgi:hydrogenase nickel insertion protein HypA
MHELSVAQALLETLDRYQRGNGGSVKKMALTLGRLGGVDPDALRYAWPAALAANGNRALADCGLEIEVLPLSFVCRECGTKIKAEKLTLECPACHRETLVRDGGRELIIKHIEVEQNV